MAAGPENVLITGGAGFIGHHLSRRLVADGHAVAMVDNLDPYYDTTLKRDRLAALESAGPAKFFEVDLCDEAGLRAVFDEVRPSTVVNLAAQAGVRYSLENPAAYITTNVTGFGHVLELCKDHEVDHLIYASSSSVYGEMSRTPFSVHDAADHPVSVYAATKRANELLAHSYSHLYGLATTGLRFFTVYGPWGRPDMAYFLFAKAIIAGEPIKIFGDGSARRDFTYVGDVVESLVRLMDHQPMPDPAWNPQLPDPASSYAPWRIFNIGRGKQVTVTEMIDLLEEKLDREANRAYEGTKAGDVPQTHADVSDLEDLIGFAPGVELAEGLGHFVEWFRSYYGH